MTDDGEHHLARRLPVPAAAAAALVVPAALGIAAHAVVLFASLAPTAVIVAHEPDRPSSRLYNVLVSHALGAGTAFLCVIALGLRASPSVFLAHDVTVRRAIAAVVAIAIATALEMRLRAVHAPAASTTLLVALGSFHPTVHDAALIATGVLAVGLSGEIIRRARRS